MGYLVRVLAHRPLCVRKTANLILRDHCHLVVTPLARGHNRTALRFVVSSFLRSCPFPLAAVAYRWPMRVDEFSELREVAR